jgi:hypothetical protein
MVQSVDDSDAFIYPRLVWIDVMRQLTESPLDPQEGPTLWLEVVSYNTKEDYPRVTKNDNKRVTIKAGTDPEFPYKKVTLNEREVEKMISELKEVL